MAAKKQTAKPDARAAQPTQPDALSFLSFRRSRADIVNEAISGLQHDLRNLKLPLDA